MFRECNAVMKWKFCKGNKQPTKQAVFCL